MFVYQGGRILQSLAKKVQPNFGPLPATQNIITETQVSQKIYQIIERDVQFLPVNIKWVMEGQAFSPSCSLAPPPAPYTSPSPVRKLDQRHIFEKGGGGNNHTTARKPGSL
jgi:hypothetical protein